VKPIFTVTCQCPTLPSTTCPRMEATSNHCMLRIVFEALAIA
jgi:hypothetical protein